MYIIAVCHFHSDAYPVYYICMAHGHSEFRCWHIRLSCGWFWWAYNYNGWGVHINLREKWPVWHLLPAPVNARFPLMHVTMCNWANWVNWSNVSIYGKMKAAAEYAHTYTLYIYTYVHAYPNSYCIHRYIN